MIYRLLIALTLMVTGLPALPALAGTLPSEIKYTIYGQGEPMGHSSIKVTETADALVLESTTKVFFQEVEMNLTCRTEADRETFAVRRVEYRGSKGEMVYSGTLHVVGDSIHMTIERDGQEKSDYRISPHERNLILEDYAFEHQILIALAQSVSKDKVVECGLVFPSSLVLTTCTVSSATKATIDSDIAEAICEKIVVSISGSEPYASFYDPERRLPVYLAFPQSNVEVFLDEFYGDSPVSRYRE